MASTAQHGWIITAQHGWIIDTSKATFRCKAACDNCGRADMPWFEGVAAAVDFAVGAGWRWDPSGDGSLMCPQCLTVERREPVQAGISGEANKKGEPNG